MNALEAQGKTEEANRVKSAMEWTHQHPGLALNEYAQELLVKK